MAALRRKVALACSCKRSCHGVTGCNRRCACSRGKYAAKDQYTWNPGLEICENEEKKEMVEGRR